MERMAVEYLANALWQVAALALGTWVLLRMWNPSPAVQHRVWVAVLALSLLLPLRGVVRVNEHPGVAAGNAAATTPAVMGTSAADLSGAALDSVDEPGRIVLGQRTGGSWLNDAGQGLAFLAAVASLHRVSVSAAAAWWIVGLWLAAALCGLLLLARAWLAARHLVADSREIVLGEQETAALLQCARQFGVAPPRVRESDGVAGPVVVGAFAPVLLWPRGMARRSGEEQRAALCHELAHIRRRDYAMNLLCELASVPLKWHPAAHAMGRRIRATREMTCDAMAAKAMESEAVYAECLVRLARSILEGGLAAESAGAGLFTGNVMEERVMRLMRGRTAMSLRARVIRGAAGAAAMFAAMAFAGMFHVVPAMAQIVPPAPPVPVVAPAPIVPATPSAPVAPAQVGVPAALATPPVPPTSPVPKVPAMPPVPEVAAVPAVPKAPPAPAVPKVRAHRSHGSRSVVIPDGQGRELTPAERARIEEQLEEAQRKIAEATAKIDSPEFQRQMEDAQEKAMQLVAQIDSAAFQKRMADARKQIEEATARISSPEFQRQIEQAQWKASQAVSQIDSAVFHKQMADAEKRSIEQATQAAASVNSAEFQKQMARINSPEFKKQIEEAVQAAATVNSAEFQKQMAEAQKQVADALEKMKSEQEKQNAKQQKK